MARGTTAHRHHARLGTEATQTPIIEKMIDYGFVNRNEKGLLFVTAVGIAIADALPQELKSPDLTTQWERRLAEIQHGHGNAGQFLNEQIAIVREVVKRPVTVMFDKQWKTATAASGGSKSGGSSNNRAAQPQRGSGGERSVA